MLLCVCVCVCPSLCLRGNFAILVVGRKSYTIYIVSGIGESKVSHNFPTLTYIYSLKCNLKMAAITNCARFYTLVSSATLVLLL